MQGLPFPLASASDERISSIRLFIIRRPRSVVATIDGVKIAAIIYPDSLVEWASIYPDFNFGAHVLSLHSDPDLRNIETRGWAESIESDDISTCITEIIFDSEPPLAQRFFVIFTLAAIHDTDHGCLQHCKISLDAIPEELLPDNIISIKMINTPFLPKDHLKHNSGTKRILELAGEGGSRSTPAMLTWPPEANSRMKHNNSMVSSASTATASFVAPTKLALDKVTFPGPTLPAIPKRPAASNAQTAVPDSEIDRINRLRAADAELLRAGAYIASQTNSTPQPPPLPSCVIGERYKDCEIIKKFIEKLIPQEQADILYPTASETVYYLHGHTNISTRDWHTGNPDNVFAPTSAKIQPIIPRVV
jgi:hypothetical protein